MKIKFLSILLCLIALGVTSCNQTSTPPAPDIVGGVYINVGYEYFLWEGGLKMMIWHDAISTSSCDSSGSTDNETHTVFCTAGSEAGQTFEWRIETVDGLHGNVTIDGRNYDLAHGGVFIVDNRDGTNQVQQYLYDLSQVLPDAQSVIDFGLNNPDISHFIQVVSSK